METSATEVEEAQSHLCELDPSHSRLDHSYLDRCAQKPHLSVPPWRLMLRPSQQTVPVCGEPECENQPCNAKPGQTTGKPKFCVTPIQHTTLLAACLECGGKNLQPSLSHPLLSRPRMEHGSKPRLKPNPSRSYCIPPGVMNNLKSKTTTPFITGGTVVYHTPSVYHPGR